MAPSQLFFIFTLPPVLQHAGASDNVEQGGTAAQNAALLQGMSEIEVGLGGKKSVEEDHTSNN